MFKPLRKKIQSLTFAQQNVLIAILILINLGIVIFWISFWISLKRISPPPEARERTMKETLESLTAPLRKESLSETGKEEEKQRLEKLLESLTAPQK